MKILLEETGEDTELKEDVAFVAYHFGAGADVDAQGRVLMPDRTTPRSWHGRRAGLPALFQAAHRCDRQGRLRERLAKAMVGIAGKSAGSREERIALAAMYGRVAPGIIRFCLTNVGLSGGKAGRHLCRYDSGAGRPYGGDRSRLETGLVVACDRDAESLEMARQNTASLAARFGFIMVRSRRCFRRSRKTSWRRLTACWRISG